MWDMLHTAMRILLQSGHHPGTIGQIDQSVPDSILAAQEEHAPARQE